MPSIGISPDGTPVEQCVKLEDCFQEWLLRWLFYKMTPRIKLGYSLHFYKKKKKPKTFFLLRLQNFPSSHFCCGHFPTFLLQRWKRVWAVTMNTWLFSLVKNHLCIFTGHQQTEKGAHTASNLQWKHWKLHSLHLDTPCFLSFCYS